MSTNIQPQFPSIAAALVDGAGKITPAWQLLLTQLWQNVVNLNSANLTLTSAQTQATQDAVLMQKVNP